MKAICVGNEATNVRQAVSVCQENAELLETRGFTEPAEALAWAEEKAIDLAVLGTDLRGMPGLEMGRKIREFNPDAEIIFLSEDGRYAVEAFQLRASGYLLKPVDRDSLQKEVEYALSMRPNRPATMYSRVTVQTFGGFEVLVNHEPIQFERSRAKELLALLVDQEGDRMRRSEIYAELWEGAEYDRKAQKMLDVIIRSLKKTLTDYQIEHIIEARDGTLCVIPDRLDCDMYRLLAGDRKMAAAFHGVYMSNYPWARMTEGYLTQIANPDRGRGNGDGDAYLRD